MQKYNNQIANWLMLGAVMVLLMVIIGGITRLTHSGLSIVTWQPIKGVLPPMNAAQWQQAFDAYKQIPEYQKVHHYFTLQDFKQIFFWEYTHRMLGRLIGIVFFVPFVFFWLTGRIRNKKLLRRLLLIFALGGLQGFAGWYMVKSGLVENTSVDHLRLALHMFVALIVLTSIVWTVFELKWQNQVVVRSPKVYKFLMGIWLLLIIQIVYGGFTAGLKAGHVFPTYPKMGQKWLPDIAKQVFHTDGWSSLINFPATVQFIHRWLGFVILLIALYFFVKVRKQLHSGKLKTILGLFILLISLQYTFGVLVILLKVPISLAVTHQVTAFILYLTVLAGLYVSSGYKSRFCS